MNTIIRRVATIALTGAALAATAALPAHAARQSTHCGERAAWAKTSHSTKHVRVSLWWHKVGDNKIRSCAQVVDLRRSHRNAKINVEILGYDGTRNVYAKGADGVTVAVTSDDDVYAVVVRGAIRNSYPYSTLVAWQREAGR